jgi:hypothetical protein
MKSTAAVAPQQVQQTVILFGRHDGHPFRLGRLGEPEVHRELLGHLLGEVAGQIVTRGRQTRQMKDRALHEHSTGLLGRVLVQRDDVGARLGQEGADRCHETAWYALTSRKYRAADPLTSAHGGMRPFADQRASEDY